MEQLPYIDEHSQRVDAPADVVWSALLKLLRRGMGGSVPIARILGCEPARHDRLAGRLNGLFDRCPSTRSFDPVDGNRFYFHHD
jgi:hypothetical protein